MRNFEEEDEDLVEEGSKINQKRFWLLIALVNLAILFLLIRLFMLQVLDSERFQIRAKSQHESTVELKAERGKIYDRNGKLIASSVQSLSIAVDPKVLKEKYRLCRLLEKVTGTNQKYFLRKINSSNSRFEWLKRGINPIKAKQFDEFNIRGLIKIKEPKRVYLYEEIASQVIGATNIDNKGISGIEKSYDSLLKGIPGFMIMQRDALGSLHTTADMPYSPPISGLSLELTLDIDLQRIVEYELKKGVQDFEARSGTVVALEPMTGEVLAMASYPTFNANNLSDMKVGSMKNKAITDMYEPGSTFKIVTSCAALEEDLVTPDTKFNGFGGLLEYDRYSIRDDHPLEKATFEKALIYSSNIIFAQIGDLLSVYKFYKYIRDFGFGNTLGIDIFGESSGKLPEAKKIYPADKQFISHGYGISVTPLQLAAAYATVANGGDLMKPFVVRKAFDNDGNIIMEHEQQKIRQVISEETCETLTKILCKVVEEGTGKKAYIPGISIAGKTGTAQQLVKGEWTKQYYASFAGYFPADNPQIVLLVVIDKPEKAFYGGSVAAPIFRNIAKRWIGVNPKLATKQIEIEEDSVVVPSVIGFFSEEGLKIMRDFNLDPKLFNLSDGIIFDQQPKSGKAVRIGEKVVLFAKRYKTLLSDTLDKRLNHKEYKPKVIGFSVKKAVALLHKAGIKVRIIGSGIVQSQSWSRNKEDELVCTIYCSLN